MFLTDLDSRAAVKGSRDPLGLVPLWGHFGRHIVGNLTTVTGSVRGFTTTLLGYYFAREAQERGGGESEATLALFLKVEQLAAYCRHYAAKDEEFRGVRYVKRNLAEGATVRLSAKPEDQILGNQKVYGLWGLYSGPARASGLLRQEEPALTAEAQQFVETEYIARLTAQGCKDGREIVDLIQRQRPEVQLNGKHGSLARLIAGLLKPKYTKAERDFYREYLILGGHHVSGRDDLTAGRQGQVAQLMGSLRRGPFDRGQLREMITRASGKANGWEPLASALQRIDHLESVLVPAEAAFGLLLGRDKQTLSSVAVELAKLWGALKFIGVEACRGFQQELAAGSSEPEAGERWVQIAEGLASGDYAATLGLLLEHNAAVMQARNGSAPWVRVDGGRLEVRFRDETRELLARKELPAAWWNNYFLNPLKDVIGTLAEA